MLEEMEIVIDDRTYVISKFPAIDGREILSNYPLTALPKVGDYKANEEVMLKLMRYVQAVNSQGQKIALTTRALIDNHVKDWETLLKIEWEMLKYNSSFFRNGSYLVILKDLKDRLPILITKILTALSGQLSQTEKPH